MWSNTVSLQLPCSQCEYHWSITFFFLMFYFSNRRGTPSRHAVCGGLLLSEGLAKSRLRGQMVGLSLDDTFKCDTRDEPTLHADMLFFHPGRQTEIEHLILLFTMAHVFHWNPLMFPWIGLQDSERKVWFAKYLVGEFVFILLPSYTTIWICSKPVNILVK